MMDAPSSLDLERTRAAFDAWRSTQPRRRRIPDHLWQQALSLLHRYAISRVAHELRLDPKQLRQRKLSASQPLLPDASKGPNFIQVPTTDLDGGSSSPQISFNAPRHAADTGLRLIFEREDGCRLTLCLPASEWDHITALCTDFIRH